ncbi:MAG: twin-arginine translocase subunit TatC [Deltaproteobacteria bacterium]|nr:twin-arginine translocase subunit TatC [Deltaproteobacteria bacterium]
MSDEVMSFTAHLTDLRRRLRNAMIAVVAGFIIAYTFSDLLFILLAQPLIHAWSEAGLGAPKLHFASPVEPFFTYIKVALIGGIFIAAPVIFYQVWLFVAPGLYKKEKRYAIPFTLFSALFFMGGASFGYFIVFPYGFRFFLGFAQKNLGKIQKLFGKEINIGLKQTFELQPTLMMGDYFALVWRLLFAFGLIFELPLVICFLAMVGLVDHKRLWKWNPYFIVLSFVVGALLTPPEPVTQVMMAGPLIVLYNLSIVFAWYFARRRRPK